jgi:putative ABC transport system permease protein
MRPRWRKLLGDVRMERGRLIALVVAVGVSLVALGAVLGAWSILTRAVADNYLGTRPAEATLVIPAGIDRSTLAAVRMHPEVEEADAREVVLARVRVGHDWRPLLLFVVDDFNGVRLNRFACEDGAWPPSIDAMLLERTAMGMADADVGDVLDVQLPGSARRSLRVEGTVHDPGLAPAWQERSVYAYAARATVMPDHDVRELQVDFVGEPDAATIAAAAERLAAWLAARGHDVHEIRIPPPRQHPHQRQMETILALLLGLAGFALVLSSILVATGLAAMLARQVREIGVMKALGARRRQLVGLYLAMVGALGVASLVVALPLAVLGAHAISTRVAALLNLELLAPAIAPWVFAVLIAAALLVPIAIAAAPVLGAARTSVRDALDRHGVPATRRLRAWRVPAIVRSALRRPARSAFTVGLLACAGAMFMTSLAVSRAWERNLDEIHATRHYDLEVRFARDPAPALIDVVTRSPGVRAVEVWGYSPAAFARTGHVDVVRTYPDRGHASLAVLAPPVDTSLVEFPVLRGRWLDADDRDAVVLNHVAAAASGARVGDEVLLSLDGDPHAWMVVGVVEEIGAAGIAYVPRPTFAATTATDAARMLRVVTDARTAEQRATIVRSVDARLRDAGADLELVVPFAELRTAVGDHLIILIQLLVAAASVLAIVGLVGLSVAMATAVVERTREIAIVKALGATRRRIRAMIVGEAVLLATASWGVATLASLPLTAGIETVIGRLGFLAPLPFTVAPVAMLGWGVAVIAGAVVAAEIPARRAAALTVHRGLSEA